MAYVWNASGKFYIGLTSDTRPDYTDIGAILHEIDLVNGIRRTYQTHDRGSTWTEISNGLLTPNTEGTLHAIAPTKANTVGGVYMATPPTYNDGDLTVLRTNVNGDQVVQLSGSILAEQLTNDDAVANVLTFSENISIIEIFHEELTWQEFTVNGVTLTVPGGGYRTPIGGTPVATVTIPSISCIVGRLI